MPPGKGSYDAVRQHLATSLVQEVLTEVVRAGALAVGRSAAEVALAERLAAIGRHAASPDADVARTLGIGAATVVRARQSGLPGLLHRLEQTSWPSAALLAAVRGVAAAAPESPAENFSRRHRQARAQHRELRSQLQLPAVQLFLADLRAEVNQPRLHAAIDMLSDYASGATVNQLMDRYQWSYRVVTRTLAEGLDALRHDWLRVPEAYMRRLDRLQRDLGGGGEVEMPEPPRFQPALSRSRPDTMVHLGRGLTLPQP